jgi:hypothetical protein
MVTSTIDLISTSTNEVIKNIIVNTDLSKLENILSKIADNKWQMYGVIASLFIAVVALLPLLIRLVKIFFKPKIELDEIIYIHEQNKLLLCRLRVENKRGLAKNVTFVAEKLFYNNVNNEAKNFLSFPLNWTHYNIDHNNLLKRRPYYLDLCQVLDTDFGSLKNTAPIFSIASSSGSPSLLGLDDLKIGLNILKVSLYSDNAKYNSWLLEINWGGNFSKDSIKFKIL